MVVLEKITAPASRSRAAGGASARAGTSLVVAAPSGTGTPLVAILSLMVARAPSGSKAYRALMCGSHTATCASTSSSTSDGENCLARKPAIRSTAERSFSGEITSCVAVLCMGGDRQAVFDDAGEHAGADRQDLVVEDVTGIVYRDRAFMADPKIGAGHHAHHVCEVLAAHPWLNGGD